MNPDVLRALGTVQAIIYLGAAPKWGTLNFFSAYDVEFANGERICGLHQSDDGKVDAFMCV